MRGLADFRPYQLQALDFGMATRRWYLAAKAGAGKTGVALALAEHVLFDTFETGAVLVVAPKRVALQWPSEARKWSFSAHLEFATYVGAKAERERQLHRLQEGFANVLCCSFEFFPELVRSIRSKDWPFGLVIFDEASRLRNGGRQGSVTWKAMNAISRKTQARICLMSGSPRPGTAHELYGPVMLLDQGAALGTTLGAFRESYLEPDSFDRRSGQVYSWKCREGLEAQLYQDVRHLYFAVAPDLGLKSVTVDREVRLSDETAAMCRELQREGVIELDELEVVAGSAGTAAGKLHQLCQGAVYHLDGSVQHVHDEKLDELAEILDEVDGPAIVCFWYEHDRERLQRRFPHAVDITTDEGMAAAKAGAVQLALLHPASAGHGIDGLQDHFADIVWFAIPASFELYDQANKRIVRSGQQATVRVWRIIAANGIVDPKAINRLAEREAEQDQFFKFMEQAACE